MTKIIRALLGAGALLLAAGVPASAAAQAATTQPATTQERDGKILAKPPERVFMRLTGYSPLQ